MCARTNSDDLKCRRYRSEIERIADNPAMRVSASLARHVETCPECKRLLDGVAGVQHLIEKMKWRSMPAGTLALCNRQAMKKLERQVRETPKAKELSVAQPDLPRWQQMTIRATRGGIGVAAGLAVVLFNWAASGELYRAQGHIQRLADNYQQRQIERWNDPGANA